MSTNKPRLPSDYGKPLDAWVYLPLILAALLALYTFSGCVTPDGEFDAPATAQELALTAADLEDLAAVADAADRPGTARALRDTSEALNSAANALEAGVPGDAWSALDFALRELEAVAAANEDPDLLLGVAAAKIVVRRAKAAAEAKN